MSLYVSNIQRMSLDDGPGIRTTVFLQGCNLFCPWCTNPETQSVQGSALFPPSVYEIDNLIEELLKDKAFWQNGGGVTLSGGEPLLQADRLYELCTKLKKNAVHLAIETSLSVCSEKVKKLVDLIDYWYIDVKMLDDVQAKKTLGLEPERFISNLNLCLEHRCNIHFRIPCSKEWTFANNNWAIIKEFLFKHRDYPVELFAVHDLAQNKYECLGRKTALFRKLSPEELSDMKKELDELGVKARIITL